MQCCRSDRALWAGAASALPRVVQFQQFWSDEKASECKGLSNSRKQPLHKAYDSIHVKLREYCLELRRLYSLIKTTLSKSTDLTEDAVIKAAIKGCRALKTKQLGQIYIILATCMGTPQSPHKQFTYEFYDSEGEFQCIKMTPLELFADLGTAFAPGDHIVMEHFPHYQSGKLYLQEQTQNIQGAREHTFVNTEMEDLEHAVVRILKADMPVK